MDAERFGCLREVILVSRKGLLDVELLEFADGLGQQDFAVEHFVNQSFKSSAHGC